MKKILKWVFYIVVALFIIGYFAGDNKESSSSVPSTEPTQAAQPAQPEQTTQPARPQKEVYQTTARKLFRAYEENEVATDEEMKGKLVEVTGIVQSIDKDFTNSIIIGMKTDNQFMSARMEMQDSQKGTALKLKKGQQVAVICERMMRVIGSPSGRSCVFK